MANDKIKARIKNIQKELLFTQTQLAERSGLNKKRIKELVNKTDDEITIADLDLLSTAMGISLFDIFNSSEFYTQNAQDKPYKKFLPGYFKSEKINRCYEIIGYDHAGDILKCYPEEYQDVRQVLENLDITMDDILAKGGNESHIPKKIRAEFLKQNWDVEQQMDGSLLVNIVKKEKGHHRVNELHTINGYLTGYQVDYFKNGIAVDTEWNSKDQTFDRDLTAMRAYYEAGLISMGIIITRGSDLCVFPKRYDELSKKYGASTTWLNQLTERLDSRRAGGCPILAIGITSKAISDF